MTKFAKIYIMEISRDLYLKKSIIIKNNGFIKVITSIRRNGKSYLLSTLFFQHLIESGVINNYIIQFAFDSADELVKKEEDLSILAI